MHKYTIRSFSKNTVCWDLGGSFSFGIQSPNSLEKENTSAKEGIIRKLMKRLKIEKLYIDFRIVV